MEEAIKLLTIRLNGEKIFDTYIRYEDLPHVQKNIAWYFGAQSSSVKECEHKPLMERNDKTLYCSDCRQSWTQKAWDEINSKPIIQSSSVVKDEHKKND